MSNSEPAPAVTSKRPFQFSLKESAVWALVLCFLFALIFQWGFWGVVGCLIVSALGVLCYGTYWGEWKLAVIAAGIPRTVSWELLQAMATIAGGEDVPLSGD